MKPIDLIPDFNCNDVQPAPIPRKPSWIGRALTRLFSRKPQRLPYDYWPRGEAHTWPPKARAK